MLDKLGKLHNYPRDLLLSLLLVGRDLPMRLNLKPCLYG